MPTLPANVDVEPPTNKFPPTPTPPTTCNAPVVVEVAAVVPASVNVLLNDGAVPFPLLINNVPAVPVAIKLVVPVLDWYGTIPGPPLAKLVAVFAFVAFVALPTVILAVFVNIGPVEVDPALTNNWPAVPAPTNIVTPAVL